MQGQAALEAEFGIPFDALFVGCKKGYAAISGKSLQVLFDRVTEPLMRSCLRSDTLADTPLHRKSVGPSWTASSGEEAL